MAKDFSLHRFDFSGFFLWKYYIKTEYSSKYYILKNIYQNIISVPFFYFMFWQKSLFKYTKIIIKKKNKKQKVSHGFANQTYAFDTYHMSATQTSGFVGRTNPNFFYYFFYFLKIIVSSFLKKFKLILLLYINNYYYYIIY